MGSWCHQRLLFNKLNMKKSKKRRSRVRWLLSEQILAQWCWLVTPFEALNPLVQAMCLVAYWHIAMAIKMASEYGAFLSPLFIVTQAATGAIWSKYSPDGSVQWLLAKPGIPPIGQCTGFTLTWLHGHWNEPRWRYIGSSSTTLPSS